MRNSLTCILVVPSTLVVLIAMLNSPAIAENIDPRNDGSQYAWAENVGWLNAEPNGDEGSGIQVGDDELSGWMWGENIGWISLSCKNTLSCGTEPYWVTNDGSGVVAGYAWSETEGWLSFSCENTATCGDVAYGVTIDPATGDLSGRAWGENIGWVIFASPVASPFKVKSGWVCDPLPAAPSGTPTMLTLSKPANDPHLSWNAVVGATGHDIISGDLATLRSTGGDFSALTVSCLDDNRTTRTISSGELLDPGDGLWFLVRGQNCGGNGTYDSGGPSQVGLRDAEIATSGADCPQKELPPPFPSAYERGLLLRRRASSTAGSPPRPRDREPTSCRMGAPCRRMLAIGRKLPCHPPHKEQSSSWPLSAHLRARWQRRRSSTPCARC